MKRSKTLGLVLMISAVLMALKAYWLLSNTNNIINIEPSFFSTRGQMIVIIQVSFLVFALGLYNVEKKDSYSTKKP